MVNPQRDRYVASADGAPPPPPPGGYRGAKRLPVTSTEMSARTKIPVARVEQAPYRSSVLGWAALAIGILFALTLLTTVLAGSTGIVYGVTMLTLQLLVVAVAIAAVFTVRGRRLGAIALSIALLLNVGTVGAMGAVQTSVSGNYDGAKSAAQKREEAFPGIRDVPSSDVLAQLSLEEVRQRSDAALAAMRKRLSDEFDYTWMPAGDEDLRPERNGYGGESMLVQYTSQVWATKEPIRDPARKLAVMDVINGVLAEYDMWGIISLNDPSSGLDERMLSKLYGSADPRTQHSWEWYSDDYPGPRRFYATIDDLSQDATGEFRRAREAQSARTGEPLEGLQIMFLAPKLLSEADRAEFQERLREYPGS